MEKTEKYYAAFERAMEEGIDFRLLNNPVEILGYQNPEKRKSFIGNLISWEYAFGSEPILYRWMPCCSRNWVIMDRTWLNCMRPGMRSDDFILVVGLFFTTFAQLCSFVFELFIINNL